MNQKVLSNQQERYAIYVMVIARAVERLEQINKAIKILEGLQATGPRGGQEG